MLTQSHWLILLIHVNVDALKEGLWIQERTLLRAFECRLIYWILIVVFFSAFGTPLFNLHKSLLEDFFGININKPSIAIISNTASIVTLSDQVNDGLPREVFKILVKVCWSDPILVMDSHIECKSVITHFEIGVIKGVRYIPTKGLELLPLKQNSVEPT